jgi:hypothetical protein
MGGATVIHYHGTPLTPTMDMLRAFAGRHAMVSYYEPRQIEHVAEVCQSVSLDNGTFPAWTAGEQPDFQGYLEWAVHWLRHPAVDWCLIPDRIDGDAASNRKLVEDWPLPRAVSVPVFHYHEPLEYARWLISNFPRIALGSSGEYSVPGTDKWWSRTAEIMEVLCDSDGMPRVKIHGCRALNPDHFSYIPYSSGDSTNVARNVGIDKAWNGPYAPRDPWVRAMVMMNRIESHASARRWCGLSSGVQRNMELLG